MIAFRAGAPDAVKESVLEAWPEVASADGVLAAALTEKWDDAYVARMVASAPEVRHVNLPDPNSPGPQPWPSTSTLALTSPLALLVTPDL